jgi:hypothetical protein
VDDADGDAQGVGLAGDDSWIGASAPRRRQLRTVQYVRRRSRPSGCHTRVRAGAAPRVTRQGKRSRPLCVVPSDMNSVVVPSDMNSVAVIVQCADASGMARRVQALAAPIVEVCDRDTAAFWSTVSGHRRVSMSPDVLQWSLARPETPPAGPVIANSSAPSLVMVDAPAPVAYPCVATASRRKVVGVDCV